MNYIELKTFLTVGYRNIIMFMMFSPRIQHTRSNIKLHKRYFVYRPAYVQYIYARKWLPRHPSLNMFQKKNEGLYFYRRRKHFRNVIVSAHICEVPYQISYQILSLTL